MARRCRRSRPRSRSAPLCASKARSEDVGGAASELRAAWVRTVPLGGAGSRQQRKSEHVRIRSASRQSLPFRVLDTALKADARRGNGNATTAVAARRMMARAEQEEP